MGLLRRAVRGRAGAAVAVAAASSATGLLVTIAVARTSTVSETGRYALAVSVLTLASAVTRSAAADPLIALDGTPPRALGRASIIGIAVAVTSGVVAILSGDHWSAVVAFSVHGVLLRDCVRAVLVARSSARLAAACELGILVGVVVAAVGAVSGWWSGVAVFVSWTALSAVVGYGSAIALHYDWWPRWRLAAVPTRVATAFAADTLVGSGVVQLVTWIATVIGGLPVAAALRAAGTLAGPVTVLLGAARSVLIPRARRRLDGPAGLRRLMSDSALLCAAAAPALGLLAFMPTTLGSAVLGATWAVVRPILPWVALELLLQLAAAVPEAAHRALALGRRLVLVRSATAAVRLPVMVVAATQGLTVIVIAAAAVTFVSATMWWISLALQRRATRPATTSTDPRAGSRPRPKWTSP